MNTPERIREYLKMYRDTENLEAFAREHGIPALLDHLGLDGLGNEVVRLREELELVKEAVVFAYERGYRDAAHGRPFDAIAQADELIRGAK